MSAGFAASEQYCSWFAYQIILLLAKISFLISTPIVLFFSTVAVYRLFLHPLSRVPGPRLAAITSGWYAYHVRNGRMLHLGQTLHQKYGPIVRVGPNELWLNNRDAFKAIYSQRLRPPMLHSG